MIILPTRRRVEDAQRFMAACRDIPGLLVVDDDDVIPAHPSNWSVLIIERQQGGAARPLNEAFKAYPNEPFYVFGNDDFVPNEGWPMGLVNKLNPWGITYGPDAIQNTNLLTFPCIDGDLARAVGWFSLPGVRHFYSDNAWTDIAGALGNAIYVSDCGGVHHHYVKTGNRDETSNQRGSSGADRLVYEQWKRHEFPKLIEAIKCDPLSPF